MKLEDCPEFQKLDVKGRMDVVRVSRLCFTCLKPGHLSRVCRSQHGCGIEGCLRRHHTLLHISTEPRPAEGENKSVVKGGL